MTSRDDDDPIFLTHAPGSLSPAEERERRRRSEAIERDRKKRQATKRRPKSEKPRKRKPTTALFSRAALRKPPAEAATKRRPKSEKPRKRKPTTALFSRAALRKPRAEAAATKRRPKSQRVPPERAPTQNQTWRGSKRRPRAAAPKQPNKPRTEQFKIGVVDGGRRVGAGLARMGQTAGLGALDRTLSAARAARRLEVRGTRPDGVGRPPWLIPALLGGLLRPFTPSGLMVVGLASTFMASGLLLLWFLPPVGVIATALAASVFATLRLKAVVDVGHGRDDLAWPEWEESFAGASVCLGLMVLFIPAFLFAWQATGAPWDDSTGLPSRVREVVMPRPDNAAARSAAEAGTVYQERAWRSHDAVREHRRAVGIDGPDPNEARRKARAQRQARSLQRLAGEPPPAPTPTDASAPAAARRTTAEVRQELRDLLDLSGHTNAALAARVCLWGALFLFPMALLAAATLKSAYAALYLPLLLGSIARAPLAYLLTLGLVLLIDLGMVLAITVPLPVAKTIIGDLSSARVAALGVTTFLVLFLALASACVVGCFYRCRTEAIGW